MVVRRCTRFLRDSKAVSALEYAILVGIIAVAISGVVVTLGGNLTTEIERIGGTVTNLGTEPESSG